MSDWRPRQAVILAGGRGTRMMPLTAETPKPMIPIHGRPFLAYVLDLLREQGFERVLILAGYRHQDISRYFGDGRTFRLALEYSVLPPEAGTEDRLRFAAPSLDPVFLLLYGDNYWPMRFSHLWQSYRSQGWPAQMTAYRNDDGYSRSNVEIDGRDTAARYDAARQGEGLNSVDIGFFLMNRSVLDAIPARPGDLSGNLLPQLAERRMLSAFPTSHRYYGVGSFPRLAGCREFLRRQPAVLLDRDGVLNHKPPAGDYVRSWADWKWLPGAREALSLFRAAGWRVLIVTNQAGVARGALTAAGLAGIHERLRAESEGAITGIYVCPHGWDQGCGCRKPAPGLLLQAQRDYSLDLQRTTFLGDDERDAKAADEAGCRFAEVTPDQPLLDHAQRLISENFREKSEVECPVEF